MSDKLVTIKIWAESKRRLRLIAAMTDEAMVVVMERLTQVELEGLQKKAPRHQEAPASDGFADKYELEYQWEHSPGVWYRYGEIFGSIALAQARAKPWYGNGPVIFRIIRLDDKRAAKKVVWKGTYPYETP